MLSYLVYFSFPLTEVLLLAVQDHVTYDLVQKMPYLDMCLSEILRLYPAGPRYGACPLRMNSIFRFQPSAFYLIQSIREALYL